MAPPIGLLAKKCVKKTAEELGFSEETAGKMGSIAKVIAKEFNIIPTTNVASVVVDYAASKMKSSSASTSGLYKDCESDADDMVEKHNDGASLKEIEPFVDIAKMAHKDKFNHPLVKRSKLIKNVTNPSHLFGRVGKKAFGHFGTTDTEVHVCILQDNSVAFVFHGTEGFWKPSINDCLTDLAQMQDTLELYHPSGKVYKAPLDVKVHRGFLLALQDVTKTINRKDNIMLVLEDLGMHASDVHMVWCVGHSLGGALATLCAIWCHELAFKNAKINCVTMGSPRVGNKAFADDFDSRMLNRSYRLVNQHDCVPSIPNLVTYPNARSQYKHVYGAIYLCKDPITGDMHAYYGGKRPYFTNLNPRDHYCDAYHDAVHRVLKMPKS